MSLDEAVKAEDHRSRMTTVVSDWYARNPDIRQLRVYEVDETDLQVVLALRPVCDSDDVSPIWLAKCDRWQEQLQALIGRMVHLDWFDGDIEVLPYAESNGHARVCLASIAWRVSADTFATPSSNRPGARRLV